MKKVIDDLGMVREDEGCCISQIANLCNKRTIIYYALDFKYKLFETNKEDVPKTNLPRLIFICANNHLYPITDEGKKKLYSKHVPMLEVKLKNIKHNRSLNIKRATELKSKFMYFKKVCLFMVC